MKKTNPRTQEMLTLKEKLTFEEIAKLFDISRQRVFQIIGRKKKKLRVAKKPVKKLTKAQMIGSYLGNANIKKNGKNRDKKGKFIKKVK